MFGGSAAADQKAGGGVAVKFCCLVLEFLKGVGAYVHVFLAGKGFCLTGKI